MEAHYKLRNGQITIKVEGENIRELFKALAEVEEVFGAEDHCGKCGNRDIKIRFRSAKKGDGFYELFCPKCRAAFDFGKTQVGNHLWPKRDGENGGWEVYQRQAEEANV